jgi:NAD dependent epimerase/dehydratase family enzyme
LGNGRQWFSWIHIQDLIEAMLFVIDKKDMEGPVNFCSPGQVQNNEFSKTLAARLNRPAAFRVPGFMLGLAAGELGSLVLNSQRAMPQKLQQAGYAFHYPSLASALGEAVD